MKLLFAVAGFLLASRDGVLARPREASLLQVANAKVSPPQTLSVELLSDESLYHVQIGTLASLAICFSCSAARTRAHTLGDVDNHADSYGVAELPGHVMNTVISVLCV